MSLSFYRITCSCVPKTWQNVATFQFLGLNWKALAGRNDSILEFQPWSRNWVNKSLQSCHGVELSGVWCLATSNNELIFSYCLFWLLSYVLGTWMHFDEIESFYLYQNLKFILNSRFSHSEFHFDNPDF